MYRWIDRHTLTCSRGTIREDQGGVVTVPNVQGHGSSYGILDALRCLASCQASNGSGIVKSIRSVSLSEEATHGVSSQDLVASMRS